MTTHTHFQIGQTTRLPDSGTVTITRIEAGVEFGEDVTYVTGINSLGQEITRWVR